MSPRIPQQAQQEGDLRADLRAIPDPMVIYPTKENKPKESI
jgi:hypothetical protein